jgi:hypothetical protein
MGKESCRFGALLTKTLSSCHFGVNEQGSGELNAIPHLKLVAQGLGLAPDTDEQLPGLKSLQHQLLQGHKTALDGVHGDEFLQSQGMEHRAKAWEGFLGWGLITGGVKGECAHDSTQESLLGQKHQFQLDDSPP